MHQTLTSMQLKALAAALDASHVPSIQVEIPEDLADRVADGLELVGDGHTQSAQSLLKQGQHPDSFWQHHVEASRVAYALASRVRGRVVR